MEINEVGSTSDEQLCECAGKGRDLTHLDDEQGSSLRRVRQSARNLSWVCLLFALFCSVFETFPVETEHTYVYSAQTGNP